MKAKEISLLFLVFVLSLNILAEGQDPVVRAFEEKILKARPLHLSKVRLLGGPLKQVQDAGAGAGYLLICLWSHPFPKLPPTLY